MLQRCPRQQQQQHRKCLVTALVFAHVIGLALAQGVAPSPSAPVIPQGHDFQPHPAIRVRLNEQVFRQASDVIGLMIREETSRVHIPAVRQCFAEGCIRSHEMRVVNFREPEAALFTPHPLNQFLLQLRNFDFIVQGRLGGEITVIIPFPVQGSVLVTGRGVSLSVYADLQKTVGDEPYLRIISCAIQGGVVDSRVDDMGLFTSVVNGKYSRMMSRQARALLQQAMCDQIHQLVAEHMNKRLAKYPVSMSTRDLFFNVINVKDLEVIADSRALPPVAITSADFLRFFNVNRLRHLFIDLNLLDSSSSQTDYTVGLSGDVFTESGVSTPYKPPSPYRMPVNNARKMVEIAISEYTLNSLLYQAHKTHTLLLHIDSKTPIVGRLLRTTCSIDDVCLSDQISEFADVYPGEQIELIIRTTTAPTITIENGKASVAFDGRCLFFLERTREKIGVIPFESVIDIKIHTNDHHIRGSVSIAKLEMSDGVQLLGLSAADLHGLKVATANALQNVANTALAGGIPLTSKTINLPLHVSEIELILMKRVLLLQSDIDLRQSFYEARERGIF